MAEKTPDTTITENMGSLALLVCKYSSTNIDDGDTYPSGLSTNVVDQWFNATLDCTQGGEGMNVSESSGTYTFNAPEANVTGTLFILART